MIRNKRRNPTTTTDAVANSENPVGDVAKQFEEKRENIKEIEKTKIINPKHPASNELCCSFCGESSSAVGELCQSDTKVSICLQCAQEAVRMLQSVKDPS